MNVTLSVVNGGVVSEAGGAVQVTITRYSNLQTDITVTIETVDGTGTLFQS